CMLRSRHSASHRLIKATKRESQPVNSVTSNSREPLAVLSLKDCLITSTPGNLLDSRQLPESEIRKTPGDVRSTTKFGLETVSLMGLIHYGIMPTAGWGDPFDLSRSPRLGFVFIDRRTGLERWINDTPGLLDIILSRKQCRITCHRVAQHPLVGVHFLG